jgi:hypothetical protein
MLVNSKDAFDYPERSGTFQTEIDDQAVWAAYVKVGEGISADGNREAYVVIAYAPTEVQAAERCMTKCKMMGDYMSLAIQEGFWGPLRRAEAQARNRAFGALTAKPTGTVIYAEGEDDKKDEPS